MKGFNLFEEKRRMKPKPLKLRPQKIVKPILRGALIGLGIGIGLGAYKKATGS